MIVRPCLLVVDPYPDGGISSRKLVLESARFNVIATYSCEEALAMLERFPRVHAVLLNALLHETECNHLLDTIKVAFPEPLRVIIGALDRAHPASADLIIESYSPKIMLEHLQKAFPEHATVAAAAGKG